MSDLSPVPSGNYIVETWRGRVRLPPVNGMAQDHEWCEILENDRWSRLRFHDYAEIFRRPGLYEHLFYGLLECRSPERVIRLLAEARHDLRVADELAAIDLGAGNGIVGERLRRYGAKRIAGVDIIDEACSAARRDRPKVYDDYVVADLTRPDEMTMTRLREVRPNCLVCVAALGFGDIPPTAYFNALSLIPRGGLLAFNIKEEFLDERYTHGFSELIRRMNQDKCVRLEATKRYRHRLSTSGEPIYYTAMIATKLKEVPRSMLVEP